MKVRVVAYKQKLVIVPSDPTRVENGWYPTSQTHGRLGCVLLDSKANLGVSEEAFELLEQIKRNHDAIGDISWWACDDGTYAFSWFGSVHRVIDPRTAEGARDLQVARGYCTIIPNEVPEEAQWVIDANATILTKFNAWAEPHAIEP